MRDKERNSSSSSSPSSSSSTHSTSNAGTDSTSSLMFSKGGYKVWALAAILLLALWSMFASTITLKHSAHTLNLNSEEIESVLRNDLDVLEVEEREKVVRHMWDVYTNSKRSSSNLGLPRFWHEAFEAAYEYLVSEDPGVRNFAVLEIAKMSIMSNDLDSSPPSAVSQSQRGGEAISKSKFKKLGEENKKLSSSKAGQH